MVKLPLNTPQEIREWADDIEKYHSVSALASLPQDASLEQIKEAFETDREVLIGIGEALMEAAKWNAWQSYLYRLEFESE